ncbi:hypothetical protein CQW23_23034 [Capsicum baccatum]|uniref:NB-ARC domain-containing protein n=1 Tax=Capsicum baccatum TaxID=33114 RepID=A0A2G2W2K9_CAPBA|nr:hypothetical protein CQW23_23034 [Capsicum baccatum]
MNLVPEELQLIIKSNYVTSSKPGISNFIYEKWSKMKFDDALDQLGMIKSGSDLSSIEVVKKLDFGRIPDECRTNIKTERLVSQLQEFVEGNTSPMCNFELDDSDPTKYMDYLDKNLSDSLRLLSGGPDPDMTKEEKILKKQLTYIQKRMRFLRYLYGTEINGCVGHEKLKVELEMKKIFRGELKASKLTQSKTFRKKKLPKGFSHNLNSLLVYLRNKKLKNFASARDINLVIEFLLFFLSDVPNHVINEDANKLDDAMIQILEKIEDIKADAEERKLNDMLKSESSSDFMMKPYIGTLDEDLSYLTSVFRDVAKVHHKDEILKDLQRRTVKLACEAEVSIDSILVQYNALSHFFCSLPAIIKESKQILAKVKEMSFQNLPLKPFSMVEPSKHLPTHRSNPVNDEEIVEFESESEKIIQYLIRGTHEIDVVPIVGMGGQGKTTIARKVYKNGSIVHHFDVQPWCIISQSYNRRDLLQEIFSQVTGSEDKGDKDDKEDILADKLKKSLMGKRYLIVLDDMWDVNAWDDLRFSFPDVGNRSRIVITTRLEEVAKQVKHHIDPYSLPFFTPDESLKLLQKKNIEESGRLEETAEGYLNDLISSNMVMVSGRRYNGKVKYCQVHDVVIHFCLNKSREEKFMLAVKGNLNLFQSSRWKDRRVSFNFTDELFSLCSKTFRQRLRSVIMAHGDSCDRKSFSQHSDTRLVKLLYLNCPRDVGIFSDIFRPLTHLKYLAVDSIFNDDWVLNLPHLETFIVRKSVHGEPMKFWKMEKLRHVETPQIISFQCTDDWYKNRQEMFDESSKLENLRIFKGVEIKEADNLDVLLRKCPNLQQLGISFMMAPTFDPTSGEDDYAKPLRINMESHSHLQSLSLFFAGSPVLGLQLPSNLKKLVLSLIPAEIAVFYISGLPVLEYLQVLCCHKSKEWFIPPDITFHKLKLLKLVRFGTTTWDASEESFPQFETLVIIDCYRLEEIPSSFADIPTLKQVKLIHCTRTLQASAERIKEDVIENEGNDRIEIITKDMRPA